jgi:hypothetical protein
MAATIAEVHPQNSLNCSRVTTRAIQYFRAAGNSVLRPCGDKTTAKASAVPKPVIASDSEPRFAVVVPRSRSPEFG